MRKKLLIVLAVLTGCAATPGRLDYDRLGIHRAIVRGGQAEIDAGFVVDVNGLPGLWLGAHRTSHGASFARLPEAAIGDRVLADGVAYRVTAIRVQVGHALTGPFAPLILQTSLADDRILLVLANTEVTT